MYTVSNFYKWCEMNIDSIKNYPTGTHLKRKSENGLESRQKSTSADLCREEKVNRGYYSGSFTGLNGAAANISKGFWKNSFDKVLNLCNDHTVIAQNLVALFLAAGLRPLAIMSLPGKKDKDDKIYASGHSIASGVIGFGFASVVMYPFGAAAKKVMQPIKDFAYVMKIDKQKNDGVEMPTDEQLNKSKTLKKKLMKQFGVDKFEDLENHKFFEKFKDTYKVKTIRELADSHSFGKVIKFFDMAPDVFLFGILKAKLTVALIPIILKYMFGLEKKKPQVKQDTQPIQNQQFRLSISRPEMTKFAGGLK